MSSLLAPLDFEFALVLAHGTRDKPRHLLLSRGALISMPALRYPVQGGHAFSRCWLGCPSTILRPRFRVQVH